MQAKIVGAKKSKWILVDIQNQSEFDCQLLNRDVWSCEAVKEIITANFIFLQVNNLHIQKHHKNKIKSII